MKKLTLIQVSLFALLTFVGGLLIGSMIDLPLFEKEKLSGSIGKVDRYRNVKVTEDDILLRNELVEDTAKRRQYERYLLFYYYKSLKISFDVDEVLKKMTEAEDFAKTYYPYMNALESFKTFLVPAREEILYAMSVIVSLDENLNVPIIGYLNQAQNAIARIKNNETVLLNLMNAIITFKENNPDRDYVALDDAHDIISMSLLQSAILTQNKPMLSYLDKKKLLNDKEGVKELIADNQLKQLFKDQFAIDIQTLGIDYTDSFRLIIVTDVAIQDAFCSNEELSGGFSSDEVLNELELSSMEQLPFGTRL
ncbi:MAG: hypothetical protein FD155_1516 [Bacteroidetes bacterium]|nr:MAG: hypothetical protein FD155_1516 [Bacteroidota bacterium]